MIILLRPATELLVGIAAATWVASETMYEIRQSVIGPESAVSLSVAINVGLLAGAAYLLFQAGGTFRVWISAVTHAVSMKEKTENQSHRIIELEKEVSALRHRVLEAERVITNVKDRQEKDDINSGGSP